VVIDALEPLVRQSRTTCIPPRCVFLEAFALVLVGTAACSPCSTNRDFSISLAKDSGERVPRHSGGLVRRLRWCLVGHSDDWLAPDRQPGVDHRRTVRLHDASGAAGYRRHVAGGEWLCPGVLTLDPGSCQLPCQVAWSGPCPAGRRYARAKLFRTLIEWQ